MRKSIRALLVTTGASVVLAMGMAMTSYAGQWSQTMYGWWYDNGNGSYTMNDWQYIDNTWYYFNQDGYMCTGWIPVNGKWYYCYGNGAMAQDSWIDGVYYVGSDGAMYVNATTPDGFLVDGNGRCIKKDTETKKVARKKTVNLTVDNWDRYLEVKKFSVTLSPSREAINKSGHLYPLLHVCLSVRPTEEGKKYTFEDGTSIIFEVSKGNYMNDYIYVDLNENGSGTYDEDEYEQYRQSFSDGDGIYELVRNDFSRSSAKYTIHDVLGVKLIPRE